MFQGSQRLMCGVCFAGLTGVLTPSHSATVAATYFPFTSAPPRLPALQPKLDFVALVWLHQDVGGLAVKPESKRENILSGNL